MQAVEPSRWKYVCSTCKTDVSTSDSMLWEGFMRHTIPAVLLKCSVNMDLTGSVRVEKTAASYYELQDVNCRGCCTELGWIYHGCSNPDEEYKQGCVLLRRESLQKVHQQTK